MPKSRKSNELYITRIYNAPVKTVWNAWIDPEQVGKWWGPRGFTITTKSKNVSTGGTWDYIMHGPNGVDYPNFTKFIEVTEYSKMVYDHGARSTDQKPLFRVTVNFTEIGGKTKMELIMTLANEEAAKATKKFVKDAGGDSTWDRLAEYLSSNTKDIFVINRTFDAPINTLFETWTDPNHLEKWLPPTGATMKFVRANICKGGESFYSMFTANGQKMFGKINYLEVIKPHKLIYTQIFCDENEEISRHPMAPTWPETMLTTIEFNSEDSNQTRVTVTWEIYGEASNIERDTFNSAKGGMSQGWTGSFDKLESHLQKH